MTTIISFITPKFSLQIILVKLILEHFAIRRYQRSNRQSHPTQVKPNPADLQTQHCQTHLYHHQRVENHLECTSA